MNAEMLIIFPMPKGVWGEIEVVQRNGIQSWKILRISPAVILFGEDEGTAEVARELGLRHIAKVMRNDSGTPLLNDLFAQAESNATNNLLCYVNADILLLEDFAAAVQRDPQQRPPLLMTGQRPTGALGARSASAATGWRQDRP